MSYEFYKKAMGMEHPPCPAGWEVQRLFSVS